MKCPNAACGLEIKDGSKFCPECGTKLVSSSDKAVVLCPGTTQDGSPCKTELSPSTKFCANCGRKVDSHLFAKLEKCQRCGTVFLGTELFCGECGLKKGQLFVSTQEQDQGETALNASKLDKNESLEERMFSQTCTETKKNPGPVSQPMDVNEVVGSDIQSDTTKDNARNENFDNSVLDEDKTSSDPGNEMATDKSMKDKFVEIQSDSKVEDEEHMDFCIAEPPAKIGHKGKYSFTQKQQQTDVKELKRKEVTSDNNVQDSEVNPVMERLPSEKKIHLQTCKSSPVQGESETEKHTTSCSQVSGNNQVNTEKLESKTTVKHPLSEGPTETNLDERKNESCLSKDDSVIERDARVKGESKSLQKRTHESMKDEYIGTGSKKLKESLNQRQSNNISDMKEKDPDASITGDGFVFGAARGWQTQGSEQPTDLNSNTDYGTSVDTEGDTKGKTEKKSRLQTFINFLGFGKKEGEEDDKADVETESESEDKIRPRDNASGQDKEKLTRRQKKNKSKAKKKEQKSGADSNSAPDNGEAKNSSSDISEKKLTVHFHVFVSEEFDFDSKRQKVILRIGNDELGGWNRTSRILKIKRLIADKIYEMEYSMEIPVRLVTNHRSIAYKYCIFNSGADQPITADLYCWENYNVNQKTGPGINRELAIPWKWRELETWNQYDGFIEKVPHGWYDHIRDFVNWKKKLIAHAEMSLQACCQSIFEKEMVELSMHEVVEILFHGHWKVYCQDAKCWGSISKQQFSKEFGGLLITCFLNAIRDVANNESTQVMLEKRISIALSCLYVKKNLGIDQIEKEKTQTLCKALLIEKEEGQKCSKLTTAEQLFPAEKQKKLLEAILGFVTWNAKTTKDPSWLYLMPWIHFLTGQVRPYDVLEMDLSHDSPVPKWWGINEIKEAVNYFKAKTSSWDIPIVEVLETIEPLFCVDYLLPRTFMSCIELKNLNEVIYTCQIPLEVVLATLVYFIKSTRPRPYTYYGRWTYGFVTTDETKLIECLSCLCCYIEKYADGNPDEKLLVMRLKISRHLLEESCVADRSDIMSKCAQIFTHCVAVYDKYVGTLEKQSSATFEHISALTASLDKVLFWMRQNSKRWDLYLKDNLQIWDSIVAAQQLPSEKIRHEWNQGMHNALSDTLTKKVCNDRLIMTEFVDFYCRSADKFNSALQECLSTAAFQAIRAGYAINYRSFTEDQTRRFGLLLSELFTSEWVKAVGLGNEDEILQHILTWPPFLQFMKINYTDEKMRKLLSESCLIKLVIADSFIQNRVFALVSGEITVGNLNLIGKNEAKFVEVAETLRNDKKDFLSKVIRIRQREMQAFYDQAELVTTFTTLCSHLSVDVSGLDETLNKQNNLKVHYVTEFCQPVDVKKVLEEKDFTPRLCAFKVSDTVLDILHELHACYKSSVFLSLWEKQCKEQHCSTLENVAEQIWTPVKKRWDDVASKVQNGTITFQKFESQIGRIFRADCDGMEEELINMNIKRSTISKRLDQLKKYRQLGSCVKGAKVILKFKKEYNLVGDFQQIETIAQYDQNYMEMRSFDESVMKTCDFLKEISDVKAESLKAFVRCGPLVTWLRQSMETGLKELKVFVDLAFMSAGDEPLSIRKVQCLHAAVTGYAPLIFDLKQTADTKETRVDYRELLEICRVVWKELAADPNLPEKLIDTNRNLEWFKDVQKAHGSVEVTSLVQADAINSSGVYTVGRRACREKGEKNDESEELASSLRLTVAEIDGKRLNRNYNVENLQDLQSRLMLVAEKGNEGVERFTSIFDSVTRLANVNNKLCSAGCVLFKDWTARFLCDRNKPVCSVLEFGLSEGSPTMKARRSDTEDLVTIVPNIAKFMEACLEEWLEYIKEKRRNYIHLNYYTIDQLVILQRELVKMGTEESPSVLIYPLLSAVKKNCTPGDLVGAMTCTKQEIDTKEMTEENQELEFMETSEAENENDQHQTFIRELIDAGFDEKLAIKALNHVESDQIADGIVWCMNYEDMELQNDQAEPENDNTRQTDTSQEETFGRWNQSSTSIQSMIASNMEIRREPKGSSVDILLEDLRLLWKKFLDCISTDISDYLSLEHLGMILKNLAVRETTRIFRKFPPSFQEGSPNLIICPSADVLSTALSLYLLEKDQELPQLDEILVCTQHTTLDEVDIFWRRAIFGRDKKIHCLVHADRLNFDVSDAAEKCLEQYIQDTNYTESRYRLVVICGSDNEYKSRIVASLDKHRRPAIPLDPEFLKEYVSRKLQVNDLVNGIRPAAYVDFNKSSVRLIKSWRAGVGKTLYKSRREQDLERLNENKVEFDVVTIPLQEKAINLHFVIKRLLDHTLEPGAVVARIFHIDIAHEVQEGVDYLLFNLLVLGCLTDKSGYVWRKSPADLYLIETLPLMIPSNKGQREYVHHMLNILPDVTCRSPQECLNFYDGVDMLHGYKDSDQLFDQLQFKSSTFQRPFQYLYRLDQDRDLNDMKPDRVEGTPQLCLKTLLRHCGVEDPSWAEVHHFVWFLNTQLKDFERNAFVSAAAAEDLPGFAKFVLRFLIQMSRDFSTRSLNMSEESPCYRIDIKRIKGEDGDFDGGETEDDPLNQYQLRRTWESSPHPYLFFNSDHFTFTFLGFYIDRASGNLIDHQTNQVLETRIMQQNLYDSLVRNFVPIQENFNQLPRDKKIEKMCNVMGIDLPHDPDDTYELTTDNVKKIMAIFMRFRCDIPVIIMGETGCGKTRLVKFMCGLQVPPGLDDKVQNMILMKVHGGTTNKDIIKKVREAERKAEENMKEFGKHMYTVLFFDEANTTESIGLIKEIMCDRRMEGEKLALCKNLKMVAACNPYRKHSEELIKKLEKAGLGYHVDADNTMDKLGRVPMRRLVYRVQPLPQSLLPLVWDFGQLNTVVEDLYIRQMVKRYIREGRLPNVNNLVEVVSAILTASQDYMRAQENECSFVSLRDVDRALGVMSWFYSQSQDKRTLFAKMDKIFEGLEEQSDEEEMDEEVEEEIMDSHDSIEDLTRSLVLSLGVCYHACLKTREQYREHVAQYFRSPCALTGGADQIEEEISCCQDVFLENVQLEKNIAKNMALKENMFMMVVCIELRIPLFLVGKPGSSKSLAKTIVSDAMQGNASKESLFKELKQVQMVSFQCSPLSTPDSIVGTFRQCAQFQKDKDLDTFVSIVVLDEVGLAEDSPRMPLKTLHPLLEDGCQGDETPEPYMKVAFIGISNWALDPAKMNRGILVQREVPDLEELENSAKGICSTNENVLSRINPLITPMCESYLEIFDQASTNMREFFGLRDFYSLVKMVYAFTDKSRQKPTWHEMLHAIKRNFGGLEQEKVDPVEFFEEKLSRVIPITKERQSSDPDCSAAGLIEACLFERNNLQGESRYLLLLTESYGSLTILQQQILARQQDIKPVTIFGSSFRSDQEYTQVCRNINKIKVCMETGNTVVLLNLENLYESLYDALNQYYVYFGGERYVDLGLGTHRVKCPVHKKFRLIVVAEKKTVYEKFPIPLINRLEKHFLNINTMLSEEQQRLAQQLEEWCKNFTAQNVVRKQQGQVGVDKIGDVFIGYHEDTCSAVILHVWSNSPDDNRDYQEILKEGKSLLLWVATPDAVVRLQESALPPKECKELQDIYHKIQKHESIVEFLQQKLVKDKQKQLFVQVTTHSKLLATFHVIEVSKKTGIASERVMLLDTLSSFDTEQQFSNRIQQHLKKTDGPSLLIIQCDSGDTNANLIACARYCVMDEYQKMREELSAPVHIVVIVQLPNIAGISYTGFQCGLWHSVHIDDLWSEDMNLPDIDDMQNKSVSSLISEAVKGAIPMETNNVDDLENSMDWQEEESHSPNEETEEEQWPGTTDENASGDHLAIEDVILNFETAGTMSGRGGGQAYQGRSLNVKNLIISCTQAALSMLRDKAENCQRTTERVGLVLTLFHGSHLKGYDQFLQGMYTVIASLLREKEKNAYGAKQWLTREAARPENIQKAGTFRRSCLQTLESKIVPILAGIIAHLDTNQNLDILDAGPPEWKQKLWLAVLNVPDALQLKYSDLQSPKRHSDLEEVVIKTTGFEGHIFKAKMPFSWLIWQSITVIMKTPAPEQNDERTDSDEEKHFYAGVFEKTPIGKVMAKVNHRDLAEIADEYLHDFVHMVYKPLSDQEFQLVTQSIKYLYNQKVEETGCSTILQMILCIHESYRMLAPRLSYFHAMNSVWPECSSTILNLQRENPNHRMFQEEEFTFSALCMLIEHLEPKRNEVDRLDGRSKWLSRVHSFRPVIEKVLRLHGENPTLYGTHNYGTVEKARCLWSRVVVMKLFLEHVCAVETEDKITVKHCMPLWKLLGDSCDLKNLKSMEAVERFLKTCNRTAIKEFLGKQEQCQYCEAEIEGPPIILPCEHLFCDQCYQDMLGLGENSCLICKSVIPDTWQVERQMETEGGKKHLLDYQRRCNLFFMDVVSQLCFYDNTPPSDEVIDKLLKYIFYTSEGHKKVHSRSRTKEMTIFDTGLDPNPVFRSFLLQLLMRTSKDQVMQNIQKYLTEANVLLPQTDSRKEYIDLGLLVIHCLEDIMSQDLRRGMETEQGTKCLKHAKESIFTDQLDVEKLYGLAEARLGLAIAAKVIAGLVGQHEPMTVDRNERKLIEVARDLCVNKQSDFPRMYLVKYICRHFGIDTYQAACNSEKRFLMWLRTREQTEIQRVEISDRFVLCGEVYTQLREALTKVILGEEISYLHETLQELRTRHTNTSVIFPLAVFREITCSVLYPQGQRKVTDKVVAVLQKYIQESQEIKDQSKVWLLSFLQNTIGPLHLTVTEGADFRIQGVQCLLIHFLVVISQLDGNRNLFHPLVGLVQVPQSYFGKYLPTMPQDDLEEVKEALLAARAADGAENPVFYRCPNGHPYVIGNCHAWALRCLAKGHQCKKKFASTHCGVYHEIECGRPATVGMCKDCGAPIGGEGYRLQPGNIQHQGGDETQTGHILGPANTRVQGPYAERQMSSLHCASVRLMMHMSMYLGAISNCQAVQRLIIPRIREAEIPEFLWQHIHTDLNDIQRGMGKSIDDVFVLLHSAVDRMMKAQDEGAMVREEIFMWSSKQGRKEWEKMFCDRYLQPTFNDCDTVTQQGNRAFVDDHRLGSDPLLCLLYETGTQQDEEDPNHLENVAAVWRYRSPVSLVHLRQNFDAASSILKDRLKILALFLKEERYLQAIRCIPSILKLQKELFHKYNRKLDKSEASQITIRHIIRDKIAGEETHQLITDFVTAWDICRENLAHYLCPTELGGMPVQKDFCVAITEDTPISMLLPAMKEEGLCPYALLDFLLRKQNDVLDKYIKEMSKARKRSPNHSAKVLPMEVTSAHLISYDTEQDLLPLILANCNYSFEVGKGTTIEYDFVSLERQIMDRFLFSKSRIDVGHVLQIDLMIYRAEITNGEVFKKLEEKVPQDDLNAAVKTQICSEMKTLPDLCQSLNNLDITISFLKSTGGNPDDSLQSFMEQTLQMKYTVHSQKARQSCFFRHIKSLWLLLALEKSKKMAEHKQPIQNIFESVGPEFQEFLAEDMVTEFRDFMRTISIDKLSDLVATLHEFILLKVTVKENRDDEDFADISNSKLCDWLMAYSDEQDKATVLQILPGFPGSILLKNSVHTWITAYSTLYEKQTGDQKF